MFNINHKHTIRKVDKRAFIKALNAMEDRFVNIIIDLDDDRTIYIRDTRNFIETQTRN